MPTSVPLQAEGIRRLPCYSSIGLSYLTRRAKIAAFSTADKARAGQCLPRAKIGQKMKDAETVILRFVREMSGLGAPGNYQFEDLSTATRSELMEIGRFTSGIGLTKTGSLNTTRPSVLRDTSLSTRT